MSTPSLKLFLQLSNFLLHKIISYYYTKQFLITLGLFDDVLASLVNQLPKSMPTLMSKIYENI